MDDYLYILDFSNGGLYEHKLTKEEKNMEVEDIFNNIDINIDNCQWMFVHYKTNLIEI